MIFVVLSSMRYELAIPLPKSNSEAISIVFICSILTILASILSMIFMFFFGNLLFDIKLQYFLLWTLPFLIISGSLNQLALMWLTRSSFFNIYSLSQFLLAILIATLSIIFSYIDNSSKGLISATLLAFTINSIVMWTFIFFMSKKSNNRNFKLSNLLMTIKKFKSYPIYMTPYTLSSILRDRIVYFFISSYVGTAQLGLYSFAQRISNAPNNLIASAFRPVFYNLITNEESKASTVNLIQTTIKFLISIILPYSIFFFFYAEKIVTFIFGDEWSEAAIFFMILIIPMIPQTLSNWLDRYFDALGRQDLAFKLEISFSIFTIFSLTLLFFFNFDFYLIIFIQASITSIYFVTWTIILFHISEMGIRILFKILVYFSIIFILSLSLSAALFYFFNLGTSILIYLLFNMIIVFQLMDKNIKILKQY
tara:strand:- start:7057 stop:8328 length:1272 start_codon:yes stop_codon:yes gene_type:complete